MSTLPETARGRPAKDGLHNTSPAATIPEADDIARVLELSDERDQWQRVALARERQAYERGFADGRARACVALAEMEHHRERSEQWRDWSARLKRIIGNDSEKTWAGWASGIGEIEADKQFMDDARKKQATKPHTLSPLEWQALHRVRLAPLDDRDAV